MSFKTGLWDCDHIRVSYGMLGNEIRSGSLLHESPHWLVFSEDKQVPVILAFDLERSFSEIPLLYDLTTEIYEPIYITKDGGFFGSNIIGTLEKLNYKLRKAA